MDFVIGLIVGLFFGGWIGLAVASLITISKDKEIEAELNRDPDSGVDDVIADTLAELKKQRAELEEKENKPTLTFNFGSLDELRKRQQERLDSEAWKEDMDWDAMQYEAEKEADND